MKWDDSLKIGCRLIDSQHQELVRHVDALERLVDSEIAGQQLLETLRFVVDYARKHFEAEEN
jgi:hemerythrin-like metal-binding protein